MKKVLFTVLLVLLATVLFAQGITDRVWTSDGEYECTIVSVGNAPGKGQQAYEAVIRGLRARGYIVTEGVKLTKGQLEAVRNMLNKYQSRRGDIYGVTFGPANSGGAWSAWGVLCEYTSDTQFTYWVYFAK